VIPLPLSEVAELASGHLTPAGWTDEVTGVEIDSRRVEEGDLFVAVGGGADFRTHAFARGAAAVLLPDDAFAALGQLGGAVRARSSARVVGITGSTGKTSTKDILAALVAPHARMVAAERSYNNELGVPLTLCRLEPDTEICIVELAMRGFGQIAELCAIARPDLGVITSVGPAHLALVGSVDGVVRAKGELLDALQAGAVAIVPAGVPALDREQLDVRAFGPEGVESFEVLDGRSRVQFNLRGRKLELELSFTARHHAENALAALLAYEALGLPLERAHEGAARIHFSAWRGEEIALPGGGLLINDSWNANPVSMRAALRHLADRAGERRRLAVLGDMAELGEDGPAFHRELGRFAAETGVEEVLAVGPLAKGYLEGAEGKWAPSVEEALALVDQLVRPGDCVLVKGSRAVGLEAVAEALASMPVKA
jgi:UDP-N-acetylmuramoyl-tripeptide--D-alanyl-D-alanine ligase